MLAMGTMPNPDALTLKLWKRASANFCQPDKLSSTLSPMFSTRKPNISTALFVVSSKQRREFEPCWSWMLPTHTKAMSMKRRYQV